MLNSKDVITQIDSVLGFYQEKRAQSQYDDLSDLDDGAVSNEASTLLRAALERLAPTGSQYRTNMSTMRNSAGALRALRRDVAAGYLDSFQELVRGEVFADFLEMAEHLLSEGYKDAAAVITGSVLEEHLRGLCGKHGVTTDSVDAKGKTRPKKADRLNADLAKTAAYGTLDQKSVTSWLDLRNNAAHGHYDEYTDEQVKLMFQGVQNFMVRVSA